MKTHMRRRLSVVVQTTVRNLFLAVAFVNLAEKANHGWTCAETVVTAVAAGVLPLAAAGTLVIALLFVSEAVSAVSHNGQRVIECFRKSREVTTEPPKQHPLSTAG